MRKVIYEVKNGRIVRPTLKKRNVWNTTDVYPEDYWRSPDECDEDNFFDSTLSFEWTREGDVIGIECIFEADMYDSVEDGVYFGLFGAGHGDFQEYKTVRIPEINELPYLDENDPEIGSYIYDMISDDVHECMEKLWDEYPDSICDAHGYTIDVDHHRIGKWEEYILEKLVDDLMTIVGTARQDGTSGSNESPAGQINNSRTFKPTFNYTYYDYDTDEEHEMGWNWERSGGIYTSTFFNDNDEYGTFTVDCSDYLTLLQTPEVSTNATLFNCVVGYVVDAVLDNECEKYNIPDDLSNESAYDNVVMEMIDEIAEELVSSYWAGAGRPFEGAFPYIFYSEEINQQCADVAAKYGLSVFQ